MHANHDFVQNTILPREINIVNYQGRYEAKGTKIEVAYVKIMLKLDRHKNNIYRL